MILALLACDPYAGWPDEDAVFPAVYTEETGLPDYVHARVEEETWTPIEDPVETGLYVQKSLFHRPGAPREEIWHFGELRPDLPPLVERDPLISFGGDLMMFGGEPQGVADGIAHRLDGLRVANLETPTAPSFPTIEDRNALAAAFGLYAFNSSTTLLDGLPLDLLQLNNNHTNDLGPPGIAETLAEVVARHYLPIGTSGNRLVLEHGGQTFAFRSYTWGLNAHDPEPGRDVAIVPFGHAGAVDLSRVRQELRYEREQGAEQVVVLVHWGYEYEYYPSPNFLRLGRELVAAGADVVVGSGPHVVQPAELCHVNRPAVQPGIGVCSVRSADGAPREAAVLYSLGDFGTDFQPLPLAVGIVATVSFAPGGGVSGLRWDPVATVSVDGNRRLHAVDDLLDGTAPVELDPEELAAYAAEEARLEAHLGTSWRR